MAANLFVPTSAWDTFTPVLKFGDVAATLGSGSLAVGRYVRFGDMVAFRANVTIGTSPTIGTGSLSVTLPFTPVPAQDLVGANNGASIGTGYAVDASDGYRIILCAAALSDGQGSDGIEPILVLGGGQFGAGTGFATNTVPFTWAAGDLIVLDGIYQAA